MQPHRAEPSPPDGRGGKIKGDLYGCLVPKQFVPEGLTKPAAAAPPAERVLWKTEFIKRAAKGSDLGATKRRHRRSHPHRRRPRGGTPHPSGNANAAAPGTASGCLPPQACCIIKREQRASHGIRTIPCSARGEGGAPLLRERQAAAVPRPCSAAGRNARVKAGGTEYKWQLPQRHTALHRQGTPRAGEPGHPHTTPNLLRLIQGASTCPFFLPALSQQPLDVQNLPVLFRSVCKSRIPPSFCSAALVRCSLKNQTYSIPLFSYFSVYQTVSQVG